MRAVRRKRSAMTPQSGHAVWRDVTSGMGAAIARRMGQQQVGGLRIHQ
jgi:hypothetical protein